MLTAFSIASAVFSKYGDIEYINLHTDPETGRSKGFAFVQYKKAEDAKKVLKENGMIEIMGRPLKIGVVNDAREKAAAAAAGLLDPQLGNVPMQMRGPPGAKLESTGELDDEGMRCVCLCACVHACVHLRGCVRAGVWVCVCACMCVV